MISRGLRLNLFAKLISTTMEAADECNHPQCSSNPASGDYSCTVATATDELVDATKNLDLIFDLTDDESHNQKPDLDTFFSKSYDSAKRGIHDIINSQVFSDYRKRKIMSCSNFSNTNTPAWHYDLTDTGVPVTSVIFHKVVYSIQSSIISNIKNTDVDINAFISLRLVDSLDFVPILNLFQYQISLIVNTFKGEDERIALLPENQRTNLKIILIGLEGFIEDLKSTQEIFLKIAKDIKQLDQDFIGQDIITNKTIRPEMIEIYNETALSRNISEYKKHIKMAISKIKETTNVFSGVRDESNNALIKGLINFCQCVYVCTKTAESYLELITEFFEWNANDSALTSQLNESLKEVIVSTAIISLYSRSESYTNCATWIMFEEMKDFDYILNEIADLAPRLQVNVIRGMVSRNFTAARNSLKDYKPITQMKNNTEVLGLIGSFREYILGRLEEFEQGKKESKELIPEYEKYEEKAKVVLEKVKMVENFISEAMQGHRCSSSSI